MIVRTLGDETDPSVLYIPWRGSATGTIPVKKRISSTLVQGERSVSGKQPPVFDVQWRREKRVDSTH